MTALRQRVIGALRRLGARPRLLHLYAIYLSAPTVRETFVFAMRELVHRTGTVVYRVREGERAAAIRHSTGDLVILGEVFGKHCYRPDAEITQALGEVRSIVDLGGNIGLFGLFASDHWPDAQIVAYEPEPNNAGVHERTVELNSLGARWRVVQAAAADHDGRTSFVAGLAASSHVAGADEQADTIDVEMVDVLPTIAAADLLKMDIEGGEWAIMGDPRFVGAPPRAVVLEYHPHLCPAPNPRAHAESILTQAGMSVRLGPSSDDAQGTMWGWR